MNKILYLIISVMMLILMTATASASFTGEWGESQNGLWRAGFVNDAEGVFTTSGIDFEVSEGSAFQPLVINADADSKKEIIISSSGTLLIYSENDYSFAEEDSLFFGSSQSIMFNALADYDADDYTEFIVFHGTNASVLEYNGSAINIECSLTIPTPVQGTACHEKSGEITCYTFDAQGNMSVINTQSCSVNNVNLDSVDVFTPSSFYGDQSPIIADLDRDGVDELILTGDQSNNGHHGIYVIDTTTLDFDGSFSGDGYVQTVEEGGSKAHVTGLAYWNLGADNSLYEECVDNAYTLYPYGGQLWYQVLNIFGNGAFNLLLYQCEKLYESNTYGGGYGEIIVTSMGYSSTSQLYDRAYVSAYRSSGTSIFTTTIESDGSSSVIGYISNPVVMGTSLLTDEHSDEICMLSYANSNSKISCVNEEGTVIFSDTLDLAYWNGASDRTLITSARMGGTMDLIFNDRVFLMNYSSGTSTVVDVTSSPNTAYSFAVDINGDELLDVCSQYSSYLSCGISNYQNTPPVINNTLRFGGYGYDYDITRPICSNYTLTFTAQETGGTVAGNYVNDLETEPERIISNCGQLETGTTSPDTFTDIKNGSYDRSRPEFSCIYNQTGTYNVRLFMEDIANIGDKTAYNTETITLSIVDGEVNSDCSFLVQVAPTEAGTLPDGGEDTFDEDIEGFFSGIRVKSVGARLIAGLVLAIMIGLIVYKVGGMKIELGILGFMAGLFISFTMNLITIFPLIILTIIAVALMVMKLRHI